MANIKITNVILSITGDHIRSLNTQAAIPLNRVNGQSSNYPERGIDSGDIYQVLDLAQAVSLPVDRDILHTLPQEYLVDTLDEIKNPLGGIRGAAQLMQKALPSDTDLVDHTEIIISEVDRLQTLVDRMLGPSKALRIEEVNITEVCEKTISLLNSEFDSRLCWERDYDPSLPEIHGDQDQLIQAILNIARNA